MRISKLDAWICETEHLPCLTRENLEALQLSRLNALLKRLRERQGFYHALPEEIHALEDLKTLPFTTPQMLSSHPNQFLITSQSEVSRVISGATSGTTGPAKRVFYTDMDTSHTIGFFAAGISEMASPGDRVLIAFPFSGSFGLGDLIEQAVLRLGAEPVRTDGVKTYGGFCRLLEQTRPDCYIGFPVPLLSLARFYRSSHGAGFPCSTGLPCSTGFACSTGFPIQRALISGDACPRGVVRELEQLLGSRLFPHYGSREMGLGGAVTCPAHEGMHLRENHILAEIIGPDLQPVSDGEWGELVITTIGLQAMPLIRYRTGDYARFFPEPCPCGSVTQRLDMVSRLPEPASGSGSHALSSACVPKHTLAWDAACHALPSMEDLDSLLFTIPELIDYRASFSGNELQIEALVLNREPEAAENPALEAVPDFPSGDNPNRRITDAINLRFPGLPVHAVTKKCLPENTFFYPGKRCFT